MENKEDEIFEDLLQELESAASFMRGMQLDSSLPPHVINAIKAKVGSLDVYLDRKLKELGKG